MFKAVTRIWRKHYPIYWALDPVSAETRGKILSNIVSLTPFTMWGAILSALLIAGAMFTSPWRWPMLGWWLLLVVVCGTGLVSASHQRAHPARPASPKAMARVTLNSLVFSVAWTLIPAWIFPELDPSRQMVITGLMAGMMCAGAFTLSGVPMAGTLYVWVMVSLCDWALLRTGNDWLFLLAALNVVYGGILTMGVLYAAKATNARLQSEREAERQSRMVSVLLRDFEEQTTDVLWEVNLSGRFTHVSDKLAKLLGCEPSQLQDTTLQGWFRSHCPQLDEFKQALRAGQPFRDVILPISLSQQDHWWSVSARPLFDDNGNVMGWRGVIADITEQHQAQSRLKDLSLIDPLTGIGSRTHLREVLGHALELAQTKGFRSALLCVDIDNFKWINDAHSHTIGDEVLKGVAQRLHTVCPDTQLARLGGDEFAVLLTPVRHDDHAQAMSKRLLLAMKEPFKAGDHVVNIGVSIGIGLIPDHGDTIDEVLANTDLALLAAKEGGRGRVEVFAHSLGERSRRRALIEQELKGALSARQFSLYWQPKVQTDEWRICGCEALLRWAHPTLGIISPAEFIPIAEAAGLIPAIGNWVLREACKVAALHFGDLTISVNASPAQLVRPHFMENINAALSESRLPASQLEIEITESLFIDASPVALAHLHALRDRGVRVALDDFGTGYSSLSYLRRFPFDTLKIDRSFVCELLNRPDARAIVRTIINLARTLGMNTVAEGVEEPAQLAVLQQAGCMVTQGFLIAKPMPLEDFKDLLSNWEDGHAPELGPIPQTDFAQLEALRSTQKAWSATLV